MSANQSGPDEDKPEQTRRVGRPSLYSLEVADAICERIVEGESLRSICRDEAMPAISSVFKWLREHSQFADQYAISKAEQAETLAEELIDISDEAEYENIEVEGAIVGVRFDSTAVARNRLRVDTRKWIASKLKPKKYGDKVDLNHGGNVALSLTIHEKPEGT